MLWTSVLVVDLSEAAGAFPLVCLISICSPIGAELRNLALWSLVMVSSVCSTASVSVRVKWPTPRVDALFSAAVF